MSKVRLVEEYLQDLVVDSRVVLRDSLRDLYQKTLGVDETRVLFLDHLEGVIYWDDVENALIGDQVDLVVGKAMIPKDIGEHDNCSYIEDGLRVSVENTCFNLLGERKHRPECCCSYSMQAVDVDEFDVEFMVKDLINFGYTRYIESETRIFRVVRSKVERGLMVYMILRTDEISSRLIEPLEYTGYLRLDEQLNTILPFTVDQRWISKLDLDGLKAVQPVSNSIGIETIKKGTDFLVDLGFSYNSAMLLSGFTLFETVVNRAKNLVFERYPNAEKKVVKDLVHGSLAAKWRRLPWSTMVQDSEDISWIWTILPDWGLLDKFSPLTVCKEIPFLLLDMIRPIQQELKTYDSEITGLVVECEVNADSVEEFVPVCFIAEDFRAKALFQLLYPYYHIYDSGFFLHSSCSQIKVKIGPSLVGTTGLRTIGQRLPILGLNRHSTSWDPGIVGYVNRDFLKTHVILDYS